MISTPIIFLVYNRLSETKEAFLPIKQIKPQSLYIVADGPKNKIDLAKTSAVLDFLQNSLDWKCDIKWNISEKNLGLANRVSSGISWAFEHCDRAIILEDDCVADPTFFKFCEALLEKYRNEEIVGCITGNNFQDGLKVGNGSYYFSDFPHCWGWATWKRAWQHYDHKLNYWSVVEKLIFQNHGSQALEYFEAIKRKVENKDIDSWAFRWTFSQWAKGMLTATPQNNLVQNIGCGREATHTKSIDAPSIVSLPFPLTHPSSIFRNTAADKRVLNNHFKISTQLKPNRFTQADYENIKKKKRYASFFTKFLGKKIRAVDSGSLLAQNKEIFGDEIYKFTCSNDCPVIIDVGANIGLSLIYFKNLFQNAQITAFEPDPYIFKALNYNIESFGLKDVTIHESACYGVSKTLGFSQDHADGGRVNQKSFDKNVTKVKAVKLSEHLHDTVDFLKIDAEGSELSILEECQEKLKNVRNLFIEYHSYTDSKQSLSKILAILEKSGFRYHLENSGEKKISPFSRENDADKEIDLQVNIFCTRQ
jgi:FkbM family methyltransferase